MYVCIIKYHNQKYLINPVTGTGHTSVDIGGDANLELIDKFCYLHGMLSVDGDADAAVETKIRIGCNKIRLLVPMLTNEDISQTVREDCTAVVYEQYVAWK